jgi:hypothetical protein
LALAVLEALAAAVVMPLMPQGQRAKALPVVQAPQRISQAAAAALVLLVVTLSRVVQAELVALLLPHQLQVLLYLALAVVRAAQLM